MTSAQDAAAYDLLPLQVWTAGPDGLLDYVNAYVTNYFCVSRERVLERGWQDLCHPQDLPDAVSRWQDAIASGTAYEVLFRLLSGLDRQYRWHLARATPVHDGTGKAVRWVGTNTEVNLVKRAEELGHASAARALMAREHFHSLLSQAPVAITVTQGPEHRIELSNQRARALVGGRNLEGSRLRDALPELAGHEALAELDGVYRDGLRLELREVPLRFDRLGNGEVSDAWFDLTYEPLRDAQDQVSGIMIVSVELTAMMQARADVERLLGERAAVLEQLGEGVIITDPAGCITFVNRAAEALHGCALLDVPPEQYADAYQLFTHDGQPHPPLELPLSRAILRDEVVRDARWQIRRADGTVVLAQGSAQPVLGQDGSKIGAVLTLREVAAPVSGCP